MHRILMLCWEYRVRLLHSSLLRRREEIVGHLGRVYLVLLIGIACKVSLLLIACLICIQILWVQVELVHLLLKAHRVVGAIWKLWVHLEEEGLRITYVGAHPVLYILQLKLKALCQLLIITTRLNRAHQALMQFVCLYFSIAIHSILVEN